MKTLRLIRHALAVAIAASFISQTLHAAPVEEMPVTERDLPLDSHFRYLLIGSKTNEPAPAEGFGLVMILPGGDGSKDFLPFCKEMKRWGIPTNFVVAQLLAPQWAPNQQVVWPTSVWKESGMAHPTEAFIEGVIDDVQKLHRIDPRQVFTISWSSGGPAAYVAAFTSKRITGSFIAMSVFKPELLPVPAAAKGRAFYLYHSPDDATCPFLLADYARLSLGEKGARVLMKTYPGGHGWQPNTFYFDTLKAGLQWLQKENTGTNSPAK